MYVCVRVQPEDGPDKIHADDRQTVKNTIVALMLKSPEQIQKQVCDSDATRFTVYSPGDNVGLQVSLLHSLKCCIG